MVTNFTATEIGDYMFAKLVEPYEGVTKVLSWNIIAGVSSPTTVGTLALVNGDTNVVGTGTNLDLQSGDQIIVANYILTVDQVLSPNGFTIVEPAPFSAAAIKFYKVPNSNNYFTYSYRWSQEGSSSDGGQMSPLYSLNIGSGPQDLLGQTFDPSKPLWIDVKAEVSALSDYNSVTLLSVTFELETENGTIESCPQFCGDCSDPWAMSGCANIVIDCEDDIYNPYNLQRPRDTYREISELASEMWGHQVRYFRVEPDQRSRDVVLMEYSLYNVMEEKQLKIVVPDNAMPSQEFSFDIFGMGFEDFEVHITKGQFNTAFGLGKSPRSRDYLYFPLMNRMYEVRSVSFADEFNMDMTYWRVMLTKYEERTSSIHNDSQVEQAVDDLVTGIEEVFGEEIQEEFDKVTKPQQYQTVFSEVGDGIRYKIHNGLVIKDTQIRNKWTVVAKNIYDLSTVRDQGLNALTYKRKSQLSTSENLAITLWFRPSLVDGTDLPLITSYNNNKGLAINTTHDTLSVKINNDTHSFTYNNNLEAGVWYGLVFNLNNQYNAVTANVYRLDPLSNWQNGQTVQDTMTSALTGTVSNIMPYGWTGDTQWSLMPSKVEMTNIRLFSRTIEQEQHFNVLQQYVVRDSQYAKIVDNAVPSIQLRRYNQAR